MSPADPDAEVSRLAALGVIALADEVRAHLERGELAGKSVIPPGQTWIFEAERLAHLVLADVEDCLYDPAARGGRVDLVRWRGLAVQLRAIERATHGVG